MLAQSLLSRPDWIHICSDPLATASRALGVAKHGTNSSYSGKGNVKFWFCELVDF